MLCIIRADVQYTKLHGYCVCVFNGQENDGARKSTRHHEELRRRTKTRNTKRTQDINTSEYFYSIETHILLYTYQLVPRNRVLNAIFKTLINKPDQ